MKRSFLAGSILLAAALTPLAARADSPREFLHHALQGDNSEIMLGNLAADRARDPAVREFGRTLVNDHSKARGEVLEDLQVCGTVVHAPSPPPRPRGSGTIAENPAMPRSSAPAARP